MNDNFPNIKIIGEEDMNNEIIKDNDYLKVTKVDNYIDEDLFIQIDLNSNDLCMFIDPIDATQHFIKRDYKPVTSLIGITLNNNAFVGFVHYPFYEGDRDKSYTYFNIPSKGVFKYDYQNNEIIKLNLKEKDEWTFCSTWNTNPSSKIYKGYICLSSL
jgi:3'-phosphoadenosine 5'-phosphosulfate (PAPS) 3'-phosphatase